MLQSGGNVIMSQDNTEAYLHTFQKEKQELIVRISWCWEKGLPPFPMIGNYYKARARFDRAIDVKTGEVIGEGIAFNWLEWLSEKKLFGFRFGYHFQRGHLYRLLVREDLPRDNVQFRRYYVEQLLEKNVNEPKLLPNLREFSLNRKPSQFEMQIDWLGENCIVCVEIAAGDKESETASKKLEEICTDLPAFDHRIKEYIVDTMSGSIKEWCGKEIGREEFMKRLRVPLITIHENNSMEFVFDDDNLFGGHSILLEMDSEGQLTAVMLAG